jgi:hypothetical protein
MSQYVTHHSTTKVHTATIAKYTRLSGKHHNMAKTYFKPTGTGGK